MPGTRPAWATGASASVVACDLELMNERMSSFVTRPPGPVAGTWRKSMLFSCASRRTRGDVRVSVLAGSSTTCSDEAGEPEGNPADPVELCPTDGITVTIVVPVATVTPGGTSNDPRRPVTGDATSALTLSVTTSAIGSPAATASPGDFNHLTSVPSVACSPKEGMATEIASV